MRADLRCLGRAVGLRGARAGRRYRAYQRYAALTLQEPLKAVADPIINPMTTILGFVASLLIQLPICVAAAHQPAADDDSAPASAAPAKGAIELAPPSLGIRIEIETVTSRLEA